MKESSCFFAELTSGPFESATSVLAFEPVAIGTRLNVASEIELGNNFQQAESAISGDLHRNMSPTTPD